MSILIFERNQIVALTSEGLMNKKTTLHYDICKDYQSGLTASEISRKYEIAEFSTIYKVIDRKCPECKRD